jgi:hypothetical protein
MGTTSTGAVSAVVSARAVRMVLVFVMNYLLRGALAGGIWDLAHGDRMAASLNVCIVGDRCAEPENAADAATTSCHPERSEGPLVKRGRKGLSLRSG